MVVLMMVVIAVVTLAWANGTNDNFTGVATLFDRLHYLSAGVVSFARGMNDIAEVMSHRITDMNHGQGFSANLATGLLVIAASRCGLPVSTTHVSCGALFGIGVLTGQARGKTIAAILTAWLTTLPTAALLGAAAFGVVRHL